MEEKHIYTQSFEGGEWANLMSSILGQFRTSVAAFDDTDNYTGLVWVYFFVATFITQVTGLNMIINLMGNTFGLADTNRARLELRTKTRLYTDYMWLNFRQKKVKRYLYVIRQYDEAMNAVTSVEPQDKLLRSINSVKNRAKTNESQMR